MCSLFIINQPSSVFVFVNWLWEQLFGKRSVFYQVGEIRRRKPFDIPCAEIPQDVVETGCRLSADDAAKAGLELVLQSQSGKLGQNGILFVLGDPINSSPEDIHCDSRMGHCDFGLFMEGYRSRRVKRDRIPDELYLVRRDIAAIEKRSCRICPVDLESMLPTIAFRQSEIMQNRSHGQKLGIRG